MKIEPDVAPALLAAIRAPFAEMDAQPAQAAVLQPLALLLDLAGETMRARLFTAQAEGGAELALRPDFTLPIAQDHIARGDPDGRYRYDGKVFQAAAAGSDEPDEFLQIGLEQFETGGDTVASDAEVAALAWRSAVAGGRTDLTLVHGDVALFGAFLDSFQLAPSLKTRLKRCLGRPRRLAAELGGGSDGGEGGDRLASMLSGLPEPEGVAVLKDLWRLAGVTPTGGRPAGEIVRRLAERARAGLALTPDQADPIRRYLAIAESPRAAFEAIRDLAGAHGGGLDRAVAGWSRRIEMLIEAGVPADRLRFQAGLGRPFGYYDGMMFEVCSAALGEARPVAAGGRYDGLMARLQGGGGAVGCMVRPARAAAEGAR